MSFHLGDRPTKNIPWAVFNAGFPDTFGENQWSIITGGDAVTPSVDIIIFSIPSGNGLIIQDIEYRVDGGSPISLEVNKSGIYRIFGFEEAQAVNIEIRTVTRKGVSDWSDIKGILVLLADLQTLLFSNDEPGFFIDADDWSTLFQDVAGTIPVTAPEQGVALALDKRLGLELGPELFAGQTPATSGEGATTGTLSWDTGSRTLTLTTVGGESSVTNPRARWTAAILGLTVGRRYLVSGTITGDLNRIRRLGTGASVSDSNILASPSGSSVSFTGRVEVLNAIVGVEIAFDSTVGSGAITLSDFSVRELKGTHATQATTAARPLTAVHPEGGVRNLLDRTEEFDNAVWVKSSLGTGSAPIVTPNSVVDPDGGLTADAIQFNLNGGTAAGDQCNLLQQYLTTIGEEKTISFWAKVPVGTAEFTVIVDGAQVADLTVSDVWQRYAVTNVSAVGAFTSYGIRTRGSKGSTDSFTLHLWGAQLEVGSEATPYQRRVNFLNVTEAGKKSIRRLYFNGTSHFMTTPVITPNTDKVQVFAGVRKLSDAAIGAVVESSVFASADNPGSFNLLAPSSTVTAGANDFQSAGTVFRNARAVIAAPATRLFTGLGDISGNSAILRANGAQVATNTGDQGTGNYLAYPVFIGARAGTSLFFNGFIDQLITRFGPNLDTATIEKTEKYISTKSPTPSIQPVKLDADRVPAGYTLSNDDTTAVNTSGGANYARFVPSEKRLSNGNPTIWYWEVLLQRTATGAADGYLGVVSEAQRDAWTASGDPIANGSLAYRGNGSIWGLDSTQQITGLPTYGNGDVVMLAFQPITGKFWTGLNGTWDRNPATQDPRVSTSAGVFYAQIQGRDQGDGGTLRSLESQFSYAIPEGAHALGDEGLPATENLYLSLSSIKAGVVLNNGISYTDSHQITSVKAGAVLRET